MKTDEFVKEAKTRMSEFRDELEELSMKATLGAGEARETIEREWDRFSAFVNEQGNRLRRQSAWAGRLTTRMTDRLERLKVLTLTEKPDVESRFNGWREEVVGAIYEVEFIIQELYPVLNERERELFSTLRIKMELYRTNLMLKGFENFNTLGAMAEAMAVKIDEVMQWFKDMDTESREKMDKFREEMRTSFAHLKDAFSTLFK